jgi:hypothetical protein
MQLRRSTRTIPAPSIPDTTSRRVTRGSESSKQTQETKTIRRTSTRLTSNPLKNTNTTNQLRKSKATQISLGVGRPKVAGGSGARAVTRSSTTSGRSRKESRKGKQKAIEEDIIEEEEEPSSSGVHYNFESLHTPLILLRTKRKCQ